MDHEPPEHYGQRSNTAAINVTTAEVRGEEDGEFQIKPRQVLSAFRRRWLLAVSLGILAAIPVAYLAWKYVPTPYRAEAEVRILSSRPRVNFDLHEDRGSYNVLKSGQMKNVKHPSTLLMALEEEGIAQTSIIREIPQGADQIDWLRNNLNVSNSGAEFFTISLDGEDPAALAKVVNAVKDAFIKRSLAESRLSSGDRYKQIVEELGKLQTSIDTNQTKLDKLSKNLSAPDSGQMLLKRESLQTYIGELQREIRSIDLSMIEVNAQLSTVQNEDGKIDLDKLYTEDLERAVKSDPSYLAAQEKISRLERDRDRFKRAFNTSDLPEIKQFEKQLTQSNLELTKLHEELKSYYKEAAAKDIQQKQDFSISSLEQKKKDMQTLRGGLEDELKGLKLEDEAITESSIEVDKLRKDIEYEEGLAQSLKAEKSKIDIEKDAGDRIEVSYVAKVPTQRETKKRDLLTAGGGFAAFGFFVVLITLLEHRFMKVNSLKCLEEEFDFPILGTIPHLPARFSHAKGNSEKSAFYQSVFTEAIDTTRTMLLNQQKKTSLKVIMVSSALSGEGKSTLSCHLAISFARAGRKTLLIDGDLRSPRVHEVFEASDFPGFCEALRDETPVSKCVTSLPIPRLDLLPAGELDSASLRLLAEERPGEILAELRERYDVIIIDSSPILPVADSLLLLQHVDGVVMSIRRDVSRISKITATLEKIKMLGGRLLGGIVIGVDQAEYGYRSSKYLRNYQKEVQRHAPEELAETAV